MDAIQYSFDSFYRILYNLLCVDRFHRFLPNRQCWRKVRSSIVTLELKDENAAKEWIIRNQFGRRNLSRYQRCELELRLEEVLKAQAKKRQGTRTDIVPMLAQSDDFEQIPGGCTPKHAGGNDVQAEN